LDSRIAVEILDWLIENVNNGTYLPLTGLEYVALGGTQRKVIFFLLKATLCNFVSSD